MYNTGNPLGSTAPKDFSDNSEITDRYVNDVVNETTLDRFGRSRLTLHGIEKKADAVFANLGFFPPVDYTTGLTVDSRNFTVTYGGVVYAAQPSAVPFTTGAWDAAQWYPIQNLLNQKNLLVFDTYAAASAAASTLPDGQVVESPDAAWRVSRYKVQAGDLVLLGLASDAGSVSYEGSTGAVATTVQSKLRETVSVKDFGSGSELGVLLQAAVNSGAKHIEIPDATNWTWTIPVVLPQGWRGRIVSHQSKALTSTIVATTGNNYPCIDAQGAFFVELDGFNVTAANSGSGAPACFVVFARMPSGASSSNHRVVNNLIEGPFYYCGIYNCGSEELYFENNYISTYGTLNSVNYRTACVVHTLNEESYFSGIVTKASRANGTSASAIKHVGDVIKNFTTGGSALYVGPNANDIDFDLVYGTTPANSYFLTLGGYFNGIRLGVDRVETEKSSPIVYAPTADDSGLIEIYRGAYLRGGAVDSTKSAILIAGGTTSNIVNIAVSGNVSWTSSLGGSTEDIYIVKSVRKTICDISFLNGGLVNFFTNSIVDIAFLQNSSIVMGKAANLTAGTEFGGNKYWFFIDTTTKPHNFLGGTEFSGSSTKFNAAHGLYSARESWADSVNDTIHDYFFNTNGLVGSISSSGSSTSYATSSDYRLKEDVQPMTGALQKVMRLNPVTYKWKVDGSSGEGFIAHELAEVFPQAVNGEKDAVDAEGRPIYQGIDTSFLVGALAAAIQELVAKNSSLEARIAALEAK